MSTSIQQLAIEGVYNDLVSLVPGTIGGTFGGVTLAITDVYKLRLVTCRIPPLTRYPAIVCGVPLDEGELHDGPHGTNETEEIGYPVLVAIFAPCVDANEAENFALDDNSDLFFHWRDIILRRYHNKLPSLVSASVTGARECKAQARPIFDSTQWEAGRMASAVLVNVMCDRQRA